MEKESIIQIDVNSSKKPINQMIYGNFVEHLGQCINNGLWAYKPVNVPLVDSNPRLLGMRQDVLQASKDLGISILRAFGGCYSDVYHWKDAIGPYINRKIVRNKAWGQGIKRVIVGLGPKIKNFFGTDEFLTFCEEIRAEPYLNVNYGTGTPEEAADWVEYCNGSEDTEYGLLRVKNGRKKPYNVKFWGIANEIYGWWEKGHEKYPENYADNYLKFAKAMREKDPSIKLIACGCQKEGWNQTLLKKLGEDWIDYLSIHKYLPGLRTSFLRSKHPHNNRLYYALIASPILFEDIISETWKDITTALGKETHVRIAFDEWGVWYLLTDVIRTNYNLLDGIWTALILMIFQKMSNHCPIANWAQLINCIGTFNSDPNGIVLTPVYLALKMFVDHSYNNIIEGVEVSCDVFNSEKYAHIPKFQNTPFIACNATVSDKSDNLAIILVNKHFIENRIAKLKINGFNPNDEGTIIELNSESTNDYNTKNNRDKIQLKDRRVHNFKQEIKIKLPAHSVTILKLKKSK